MIAVTVAWRPSKNPNTIWNRLTERLGREPTNAEATAEVKRILRGECGINSTDRGGHSTPNDPAGEP